jgi:hypothetical protein
VSVPKSRWLCGWTSRQAILLCQDKTTSRGVLPMSPDFFPQTCRSSNLPATTSKIRINVCPNSINPVLSHRSSAKSPLKTPRCLLVYYKQLQVRDCARNTPCAVPAGTRSRIGLEGNGNWDSNHDRVGLLQPRQSPVS